MGTQIGLKLGFWALNPTAARSLALRKSRSKMVLEALGKGDVERGNVGVHIDRSDSTVGIRKIGFSYRGTIITTWDIISDILADTDAGDFEHTPSTFNQRKLAREAIDELRKAVGAV